MTLVDDTQVIPRQPATVDETGGLEVFLDILDLRSKRDAAETIVFTISPDPAPAPEPAPDAAPVPVTQPAQSHASGFLRRVYTRVKAAISAAVATVREATKWLFSDLPSFNPKLISRFRNRFFGYKGRHNVQRAWYGVQRSTAASVAITRERHARAQQTSRTKEGVLSSYFPLPEYWVSHMADLIQTIRDEHSVFHPNKGRHWECS